MNRVVAAFFLLAAGCGSNESRTEIENEARSASAVEPVSKMLKAGKPEACAHPAVKERFIAEMTSAVQDLQLSHQERHGSFTREALNRAVEEVPVPTLSEFQALEADRSIGALTCGVNFHLKQEHVPVYYLLRPSLEDDAKFFVVFFSPDPKASPMKPELVWQNAVIGHALKLSSKS